MIRRADKSDVPAIVAIEERCFSRDRFSPRSLQHLVTKANGVCFVAENRRQVQGYALVLYNQATRLARLYSFAVDPNYQGLGIGRKLLRAAEEDARKRECLFIRLEVRSNNKAAIKIYKKAGYKQFDLVEDYYSDHADAVRMEKSLVPRTSAGLRRIPFYAQTLDFTCGPAALMMAMKGIDARAEMTRREEMRLWRESTTVFMMSGHGGCGPSGLALAAWRRGFMVELYATNLSESFLETVRHKDKREVMRIVQRDFADEIDKIGMKLHHRPIKPAEIAQALDDGRVPLILISTFRLHSQRYPHWVVAVGHDDANFYVHDPWINQKTHGSRSSNMNIPIPMAEFARMSRFGKANLRAALLIGPRRVLSKP